MLAAWVALQTSNVHIAATTPQHAVSLTDEGSSLTLQIHFLILPLLVSLGKDFLTMSLLLASDAFLYFALALVFELWAI